MESIVYHKCVGCRVLREESDFEVNKGKRRKSCLKCKRKRIKLKDDKEKNHIKTLIESLESKIDLLSIKPVPKPLEDHVQNDCVNAVKLADFIESIPPTRLRQPGDLLELIRESYLALDETKRPFYSRDKELWVKTNDWKKCPTEILFAIGETISDNCGCRIQLKDDFVEDLLKLSNA